MEFFAGKRDQKAEILYQNNGRDTRGFVVEFNKGA